MINGFPSGFASLIVSYLAPSAEVAIDRGQVWLINDKNDETWNRFVLCIHALPLSHIPLYPRSGSTSKVGNPNVDLNKLKQFLIKYAVLGGFTLRLRRKSLSICHLEEICIILESHLGSTLSVTLQGALDCYYEVSDVVLPQELTLRLIRAMCGKNPMSLRYFKLHSVIAPVLDLTELSHNFKSLHISNCKIKCLMISPEVSLERFEYISACVNESPSPKSSLDSAGVYDPFKHISGDESNPFIKVLSDDREVMTLKTKRLVMVGALDSIRFLRSVQSCIRGVKDLSVIDHHPPRLDISQGRTLIDLSIWQETIKSLTICRRLVDFSNSDLFSNLRYNQYFDVSLLRSKLDHINII